MDTNYPSSPQASIRLYLATFSAFLGAVAMGATMGWSSPAFSSMANDPVLPLKDDDPIKSWIGSCITLGALGGGLIGGPISQMIGRKKALILYGLPFTAGWILICASKTFFLLIIGRVLTGFCAGLVSGTAPTYVTEISTPSIRGMLGSMFQLLVVIGILIAYVFGSFIAWNYLAIVLLIPSVLMSVTMIFMPESPIWLISKPGRAKEAKDSLTCLRSSDSDIFEELKKLQDHADNLARESQGESFGKFIRRKDVYKPYFLSLGLMLFQHMSGITVIIFYSTDIFAASGSSLTPSMSAILIAIALVISTAVATQLLDRLGRKILLLISGVGHTLSLGVIGYYYFKNPDSAHEKISVMTIKPNIYDTYDFTIANLTSTTTVEPTITESSYGWVLVVFLIIFVVAFSLGYGPVPWMMIPEMTPTVASSLVSSSSTAFNWALAFLITNQFQAYQIAVTKHGTFWTFCGWCIVSLAFVVFLLPETKGRTIDEISRSFRGEKEVPRPSIDVGQHPDRSTTFVL